MKIFEKIKEWWTDRKYTKYIKSIQATNKDPKTYKKWEHTGWGDAINITKVNEDGTFRIVGWLWHKPKNGDYLIYKVSSGKKAKGLICEVEYCGDPHDMFFAKVIPLEYYEEKTNRYGF